MAVPTKSIRVVRRRAAELAIIAFLASLASRQQNILWAFNWSTPKALRFWKGTAMIATHRVNPTAGSVVKFSRVNFPASPAVVIISPHPPSIWEIIQNRESRPAPTKRKNCITSVQITVRIPPIQVHPTANNPIIHIQCSNSRGVTTLRARAATSTRTLCPRIPPIWKMIVANRFAPIPSRLPIKS